MILTVAIRNVGRNLRRLRPVVFTLVVAFSGLFLANAILQRTDRGFAEAYVNYVSGQVTIGEQSEDVFTLFGAEALLVGEYLTAPTLSDPDFVRSALASQNLVDDFTFIVTSAARLEVGARRASHFVFGVDGPDYARMFPQLGLQSVLADPGDAPWVVLQPAIFERLFGTTDVDAHLGSQVLLTSPLTDSFVIREATLVGLFEYPVDDPLLSEVVLTDADTARALNGYVYGAGTVEETGLMETDLDELFASPDAPAEESSPDQGGVSLLDELDALFAETESSDQTGPTTIATAWNYALVRGADDVGTASLLRAVRESLGSRSPYLAQEWRASIGGDVLVVSAIRAVANAGIVFIIFGATIIAVNSITISVLERTREIGTMRALGATRSAVARLLGVETASVVLGAAGLGVALGGAVVGVLNLLRPDVENRYLRILFGGSSVGGDATAELVAVHIGAALAMALIALIYPIVRAIRIGPLMAMNQ